jgi:hypothetical protein
LLFLSLFSSLIGIGPLQASQTAIESLVTKELVVVNEYGQEVVNLSPSNFGGSLSIFTNEGDKVAVLQTLDDIFVTTELKLQTPLDEVGDGISITAYGGPGTRYFGNASDHHQDPSYNISFRNNLTSYVSLNHGSNGTSLEMETHPNEENIQNSIRLSATGNGSSLWFSSMGDYRHYKELPMKTHLSLWGSRTEGGSMSLYNEHGDDRASLFQTVSGHGGLWVYDKYGENSTGYIFEN